MIINSLTGYCNFPVSETALKGKENRKILFIFLKKDGSFIKRNLAFGVKCFRIFMLLAQVKKLSTLTFRSFLDI